MNHGPWKGLPSANLLSSTTPTARTDHTFPYNRLGRVVKAIMRQQLGRPGTIKRTNCRSQASPSLLLSPHHVRARRPTVNVRMPLRRHGRCHRFP
jgi:hypothetical protein